jgi:hypothetical protein
MYAMTIEPGVPFNALDVLVARDEGLFAEEGLALSFAQRTSGDFARTEEGTLARPAVTQGKMLERGDAGMFQA